MSALRRPSGIIVYIYDHANCLNVRKIQAVLSIAYGPPQNEIFPVDLQSVYSHERLRMVQHWLYIVCRILTIHL